MTKVGSRKLHICPKVTKMLSIIGHRIDYNGVVALRGGGAHQAEISPPPWHMSHKYTEVKLKIHTYKGCFKVRSDFFLRLNFLDYKNYFSKISMLFLIHLILQKKEKKKKYIHGRNGFIIRMALPLEIFFSLFRC